jgi:hypothetical protein
MLATTAADPLIMACAYHHAVAPPTPWFRDVVKAFCITVYLLDGYLFTFVLGWKAFLENGYNKLLLFCSAGCIADMVMQGMLQVMHDSTHCGFVTPWVEVCLAYQ